MGISLRSRKGVPPVARAQDRHGVAKGEEGRLAAIGRSRVDICPTRYPICPCMYTHVILAAIWNFPKSPLYHSALPPASKSLLSLFASQWYYYMPYTKSCVSLVTCTQSANLMLMDGWDASSHAEIWVPLALHQSTAELDGLVPASGADYRHTQRYGSTQDR